MSEHELRDVEVRFDTVTVTGRATGFLAPPTSALSRASGWFEMPPEEVSRLSLTCGCRVAVSDATANRQYNAIVVQVAPKRTGWYSQAVTVLRLGFESDGAPTPIAIPPVAESNPAEKPPERRLSELVAKEKERSLKEALDRMREQPTPWKMLTVPAAIDVSGPYCLLPDPAIADLTRRVEALEAAVKALAEPGPPAKAEARRKKYDGWEGRSLSPGEAVELWDALLGEYNPNRVGVVEHSSWEEDAVQYVTEYRVRLGLTRVVTVAPDGLRPAGR